MHWPGCSIKLAPSLNKFMAPSLDGLDVAVNAVLSRVSKTESDVNELHTKQREIATRLDQNSLFLDDIKTRTRVLELHDQDAFDNHHDVAKRVDLLESKLDDMRSNLTKVIEGQMQILNANTATQTEFKSLLTTQGKQHLDKMKRMRMVIYIGGGLFLLASQIYAQRMGNVSMLDSVFSFITNAQQNK